MMTGDIPIEKESIYYREIEVNDKNALQSLHLKLFPVVYSESFFENASHRRGPQQFKQPLFSSIAVSSLSGQIVGFVLAQMVLYSSESEEKELFGYELFNTPEYVCYVLTLGVAPEYRRLGLACKLLDQCKSFSASYGDQCGGIYLHVINYNTPAIRLYEKSGFQCIRHLPDFYLINHKYFDAMLYVYYSKGYQPPLLVRCWSAILRFATWVGLVTNPAPAPDGVPNNNSNRLIVSKDNESKDDIESFVV